MLVAEFLLDLSFVSMEYAGIWFFIFRAIGLSLGCFLKPAF
jgi:hypothetical protein